jgi:hypothetical protein
VLPSDRRATVLGLLAAGMATTGMATSTQAKPNTLNSALKTAELTAPPWISVKDFGAVGDGIADDGNAIQRAIDSSVNASMTPAFNSGGSCIFFPPGIYRITSPIRLSRVNIHLQGVQGATVIRASENFKPDNGNQALGRWIIIADTAYIGYDLYNIGISGFTIDINNQSGVSGILINGGRNTSFISNIQFVRFGSTLIRLGGSKINPHSITQGFVVRDVYAYVDTNPGGQILPLEDEYFVLAEANECVFDNVHMMGAYNGRSCGSMFRVGFDKPESYQCGGNRFTNIGATGLSGIEINCKYQPTFQIGEKVQTPAGFEATVDEINGKLVYLKLPPGGPAGKFIPIKGDSIKGASSKHQNLVVSSKFGTLARLGKSWNSQFYAPQAIEIMVCGFHFNCSSQPTACTENIIDAGRFFAATSSCFAVIDHAIGNLVRAPHAYCWTYLGEGAARNRLEILSGLATDTLPILGAPVVENNTIIFWKENGLSYSMVGKNQTLGQTFNLSFAADEILISAQNPRASEHQTALAFTSDGGLAFKNLPTKRPQQNDRLWLDKGTLKST